MKRHVKIDSEAILALIKREGYKIGEFAEELNISYRTLKRYFDERRMPRETYHQTARILNVQCETLMHSPPQDQEGEEDLKRRDFFQLGIATTLTTATTERISDPDLWERLSKALKKPGRVDSTVIESINTVKDHCYHMLPDIIGYVSPNLLAFVSRQLESVTTLLEGSPPIKYQRSLSSLAAEFSVILGAMNRGLKDDESGTMMYSMALECATIAGERVLQAITQGRIALLFIHNGQARIALDYIQKAKQNAENGAATPTTKSWLAAIEAEAYANVKKEKSCLRALDYAGQAIGHGREGQDPYWTTFDSALYAGYQGVCYLKLERFQDAQTVLLKALKVPGSQYKHAFFASDLAGVYIAQGNIDAACMYTKKTFELSEQTGSPWFPKQVKNLCRQLDPWRDSEPVRKLDELLTAKQLL